MPRSEPGRARRACIGLLPAPSPRHPALQGRGSAGPKPSRPPPSLQQRGVKLIRMPLLTICTLQRKGGGGEKRNVAIETLIELPPSWYSSPPPAGASRGAEEGQEILGLVATPGSAPPVPNTSTEPRCPPRPRKPGILYSPQGSPSRCLSVRPSVLQCLPDPRTASSCRWQLGPVPLREQLALAPRRGVKCCLPAGDHNAPLGD